MRWYRPSKIIIKLAASLSRATSLSALLAAATAATMIVTPASAAEKIRVGKHPTYGRMVLDYGAGAPAYQLSQQGSQLTITLNGNPFGGSLAPLTGSGFNSYVKNASRQGSALQLTLKPGLVVKKHFKNQGKSIVIDLAKGKVPPVKTSAKTITLKPTVEAGASQPVSLITPKAKAQQEQAKQQHAKLAAAQVANKPAGTQATLIPSMEETSEQLNWSVDWGRAVPLAAFQRAGYVWLVFGEPRTLLQRPEFQGAWEMIPHTKATVVRLRVPTNWDVAITRQQYRWQLTASATKLSTRQPAIAITQLAKQQVALAVDVDNPAFITIVDPTVGDTLKVLPVNTAGAGVRPVRRYPLYTLLPTLQGVAVAAYGTFPPISMTRGEVVIGRKPGEAKADEVSAGQKAQENATPAPVEDVQAREAAPEKSTENIAAAVQKQDQQKQYTPPKRAAGSSNYLIPFAEWRRGSTVDFYQQKQALQNSIVNGSLRKRQQQRLKLAKFLFAHGFHGEAIGVLAVIEEGNASMPGVQLVKGAASYMLNRQEDAKAAFTLAKQQLSPAMRPEFSLWEGANLAALGETEQAQQVLRTSPAIPQRYPMRVVSYLGQDLASLYLAETDLTPQTLTKAELFLDDWGTKSPYGHGKDRLNYLKAMLQLRRGEEFQAYRTVDALQAADDPWTSANARYEMVLRGLEMGRTTPIDAIKELERLRYAWRGGSFELKVLDKLGSLYLEQSQYQKALTVWRQAKQRFPQADALAAKLRTTFLNVFSQQKLPAIQSLAMFDKFRDLVPDDTEGDKLMQQLADQLVAVDLLSRAGDLLRHQITKRLDGSEKSRVGAHLALIQLLDYKPEEALQTLELSRFSGIDNSLRERRRHLRVRALAMKGSIKAALQALGSDKTITGRRLRGELYWQQQQYVNAATELNALVNAQKDPEASDVLNLALALSLSGQDAGLQQLRKKHQLSMMKTAYGRTFQLVTDPSGQLPTSAAGIEQSLAEVAEYRDFLASYREQLKQAPLSTLN